MQPNKVCERGTKNGSVKVRTHLKKGEGGRRWGERGGKREIQKIKKRGTVRDQEVSWKKQGPKDRRKKGREPQRKLNRRGLKRVWGGKGEQEAVKKERSLQRTHQ